MKRSLHRLVRGALCLLVAALLPSSAHAGWAVNGDAVVIGNQVLLTPENTNQAGSAWIETRINLSQDFDISFEMSLGDRDANGADGISFALHDDPAGTAAFGNTASGGEWIGMNSICPAVSVEVDTYQNSGRGDPTADHLGINVYTAGGGGTCNGVPNHNASGPVQASPSTTNIEDGTEYQLRVTWDASATTMTVYFDGSQRMTYVSDFVNNTFGGNSQVYFGFTASTGGSFNEQYIIPNSAAMGAVKYAVPSVFMSTDTSRTTTYSIDITNSGIVTAFGTQISDSLPTGFTYIPGTTTGATTAEPVIDNSDPNSQLLSWNLTATPIPPNGGTTSISFGVAIDNSVGPGTHRNDFVVSGDNFTTINQSQTADILIGPADLSVDKSHTGSFVVGQNETFDIDVSNAGPDEASDIVVTDTLPAGMTYVSTVGTGWVVDATGAPTITWTHAGTVASGASAPTIEVTVAIDGSGVPSMSNIASVTAPAPDIDLTGNSDTDVILVDNADVSIVKSHAGDFNVGIDDTFDLDVSSAGPNDTTAIVVTDTLPAGLTYVSSTGTGWVADASGAPTITWTHAGPLPAAGSLPTITVTVAVDAAGVPSLANVASVTHAVYDPVPANDSDLDTINVLTPGADVSIAKSHVGSFVAGSAGVFSLDVQNAGPLGTTAIVVTDTLPTGLTYVSSIGAGWVVDASGAPTITWSHPGPLLSASALPTILVTVAADAGGIPSVVNTASVTHGTSDPDATNDTSSDTIAVVANAADLSVQKNHSGAFTEGVPGSYDIVVSNAGPAPTSLITVTDVLDPGFTYVSSSGTGWTADVSSLPTVTWTHPGPLVAGASLPTLTLTVTPSFGSGPTLTNSASVSSPTLDPNGADDSDSDPTTIIGAGTFNKPLYVKGNATRLLSRDPTAGTNTAVGSIDGAGSDDTREWSIDTVFAQGITLASGDIPVTLYMRRNGQGSSRTIQVELEYQEPSSSRTSLGTDTQIFTIASGGAGTTAIPFTITLGADVAIAAGSDFFLTLRNLTGVANQRVAVDPFDSGNYSTIGLTTLNVITVDALEFHDAAYPANSPTTTFAPGANVWVRALVSDPFGVADISGAEFDVIDPNSVTVVSSGAPTNSADLNASTRMYEYAYTLPALPVGTWTARARASEGTEGWVTDVDSDTFDVQGPAFSVAKISSVISDPVNGMTRPKRIPGALVQFSVGITNNGLGPADADTFEMTDSVPTNTRMYVGDLGGVGSGPVSMTPGAVPCGMTYTFVALGSTSDDVDFSSNGGSSFNYTPSPDADGFDAGVTDVLVNPKGIFTGGSGTPPSCTINFRVQID